MNTGKRTDSFSPTYYVSLIAELPHLNVRVSFTGVLYFCSAEYSYTQILNKEQQANDLDTFRLEDPLREG